MFCTVTETWQSWFNAPDLKSDEGASPPGVRIPASPPVTKRHPLRVFFCNWCKSGFEPRERGSTTSERRARERRSAKPISARATEWNEVNPCVHPSSKKHQQSHNPSPSLGGLAEQKERGALFLPRAIAVLGERLGSNANKANPSTGLTEAKLASDSEPYEARGVRGMGTTNTSFPPPYPQPAAFYLQ